MAAKKAKTSRLVKKKANQTDGSGKPLIPIASIEIVGRPLEGQEHEQIFYNPRDADSFTPESMAGLCRSIRVISLLEYIIVRATGSLAKFNNVQLLAGERRLRALLMLVESNVPCISPNVPPPTKWREKSVALYMDIFVQVVKQTGDEVEVIAFDHNDKLTDERLTVKAIELATTLPASKLYKAVECNVFYNISDSVAMSISMAENKERVGLTLAEEISVVERLIRRGLKQKNIAYLLASNDTWVSQTASFRTDLPPDVFDRLLDGRMSRNTAVQFFGYRAGDRKKLFEETILVEELETNAKLQELQAEMEQLHDEADLLHDDASEAIDPKVVAKATRAAESAKKKAETARKKRDKTAAEAGTITATHVSKGAAKAGVKPKKAKMLPKGDIETLYVDQLESLLDGESADPICGKAIPPEYISIMRGTATAILQGDRDPLKVIRDFMVSEGMWQIPETSTAAAELEDSEYDPEIDEYEVGPDDDTLDGLDYDDHEDDGSQDMDSYMQPDDVDNT